MRLKGKSWFIQLFSIANNYANRKKISRFDGGWEWSRQKGALLCFALASSRMTCLLHLLSRFDYLSISLQNRRVFHEHEQPSLLLPINLAPQMLALFSSSMRKSKASIIKLAENSGGLRAVSFLIFNQGSVMFALFSVFRATIYCR